MADADAGLLTDPIPIYPYDRPETGDFEMAPAQFNADAIENNYWFMRQRRTESAFYAGASAISEAVYGSPDAWLKDATVMGALGPMAQPTAKGREAALDRLFADLAPLQAAMPGEFANLPASRAALWDNSLSTARRELQEDMGLAQERVANRSDPNFVGGVASFAGSMAAGVSDVEGVMSLPFGGGGSLARTLLIESLLGGAGAAAQIPGQQNQAEFLHAEAPDPVLQVLSGFAFGGALPIVGRGLKMGLNTLTPGGRIENRELLGLTKRNDASPGDRGAAAALGREEAVRDTAPDGISPEEHTANTDASVRAAEAEPQIVRPGDVIPQTDLARPPGAGGGAGAAPVFDFEPGGNAAADANQVGYVFGRLLEKGASPKDAAALLGNLMQESGKGLNTGAIGDGGNSIGMGQWNGPRRRALIRFAEARGVDWRDLDTQVEYLWRELNGSERAAWDAIRAAPDAATGARIASERFWRPGVPHLSNRMAFARMVDDQYTQGEVPKGGAPGRWRNPGDDALAGGVYTFSPRDIQTDAAAYQFKMGGDQFGVTERLQGERVWDASAAVGVIVHERLDGTRYIADGHQRMGLARRLMERGHDPITLQGFLYREADGFSVENVRALAALRNIRQESGSPLDAAKVMRDNPELARELGSRSRPFMAQAAALADLAPGPFQAIVNEVIPQNWGAIVGRIIPDEDRMQGVAIAALKKAAPANETQAESIVRDIRRMGLEQAADDAQMDLFGDGFDLRQTVISERARVIDRVMKDARADRAIFGKLEREAAAIEEAGNVLDREANLSRADLAERTLARLLILADQPGPVRDAIDAAARALRAGENLDAAARQVTDALGSPARRADAGGPAGGGIEAAPITAVLKDAAPDDYVRRMAMEQPFDDLDMLYARAPLAQERLSAEASIIASDLGVKWKNPGLKKRATVEEKITRKSYDSPRRLTDVSRGGFVVADAKQSDDLVHRLSAIFDIVDEGWVRTEAGYIDRKVIVRHPNGMLSEVQIWTEEMLAAKAVGQPIYTQRRSTPRGSAEYNALIAREVEIYSAAARGKNAETFASVGTSPSPMLHPNRARKAASEGLSDSTPAVSNTSSASTGTQGLPGDSWASAKSAPDGSSNRAAGRPSQLEYERSFMGNVPFSDKSNMGAARPAVNDAAVGDAAIQPGLFDDPIEDAAEIARLDRLDRDLSRRLADPAFDLSLPADRAANSTQPAAASLRSEMADLQDEGDFAETLKTICDLSAKGPRP